MNPGGYLFTPSVVITVNAENCGGAVVSVNLVLTMSNLLSNDSGMTGGAWFLSFLPKNLNFFFGFSFQ